MLASSHHQALSSCPILAGLLQFSASLWAPNKDLHHKTAGWYHLHGPKGTGIGSPLAALLGSNSAPLNSVILKSDTVQVAQKTVSSCRRHWWDKIHVPCQAPENTENQRSLQAASHICSCLLLAKVQVLGV